MLNPGSLRATRLRELLVVSLLFALFCIALLTPRAAAQGDAGGGDAGACTLKNHVYTCDGATFEKALAGAKTVSVETHNADGVARAQLKDLVTKKLGKTIAAQDTAPDLIFLLIPIGEQGINNIPGNVDLGTLRIYSPTPDGARGHLLWAETYSGQQDLPWPAVVHSVIQQFQGHFHIK